ncbi:hypothetical protein CBS101457_005676 [Exobasidium rhododendri]|nr:hypothetical protein CBS101457_005676 [Exobasidium rhododendri]
MDLHHATESSVPDVPGDLIEDAHQQSLRGKVSRICGLNHTRFPGAQPVSFTTDSLQLLKEEDFWLCEKSDGQRVLMLIVLNKQKGTQEVYLIDRKNNYRQQHPSLFFPYHEMPPSKAAMSKYPGMLPLGEKYGVRMDTLLDGELVWDKEPDGRRVMRLLLFDCIVLDGEMMAHRSLLKRYGRLQSLLLPPFKRFMQDHPDAANDAPFEIKIKTMELAYGIRAVLFNRIPNLKHGNDGLIFTCANSGYAYGTDPKIIKWKPPSENTIDFKLRLYFPPDLATDPHGNLPDLTAKPFFALEEYMGNNRGGGDGYRYFDWLHVEDEEWEIMKKDDIQYDDRIVECSWDPNGGPLPLQLDSSVDEKVEAVRPPAWRLHRIRDDKTDGNHTSIVQKIIRSIEDGVEQDQLLLEEASIRAAWKSKFRSDFRQAQSVPYQPRTGPPPPMRGTPPEGLLRR